MNELKIVSIDMFGTLVDIDGVAQAVWKIFLGKNYTPELAEQYWNRASELVFGFFEEEVIQKHHYLSPVVIFEKCYHVLFEEIGLDFNPEEAAQVLAYHHSLSLPFKDAIPFLNSVGDKYPICVSSDTNDLMLGNLTNIYPFDNIFTSDALQAYKSNAGGKFFSSVIEYYQVKPENIIHIGDSSSDIVGADEAGLITCWINRDNRTWNLPEKPDHEVNSLRELGTMLLDVN